MAKRRNKGEEKRVARGRIGALLGRARRESTGPDPDLADRYAHLATRVATRYQTGLNPSQKVQLCKGCHSYRVNGTSSRTRVHRHRLITTCLRCGRIDRRPL